MKAAIVTMFMTSLITIEAFAHGMNKPGPHNGYVRMPSNYHVELVTSIEGFHVYFLDMQFKSVSINNSSVNLQVHDKITVCQKTDEYFKCKVEKSDLVKAKKLIVESSRDGKAKINSTYNLPLSLN